MVDYKIIVALIVLVFMSVEFLRNKRPYGVTTMACIALLTITGVIDAPTAFSGFSDNTTVLVATLLVISSALVKTSFINNIKAKMAVVQGTKGFLLLLLICAFTILLITLLGGMTAVMSIMLMAIMTLSDESDLSQSRMIFIVGAITCAWYGRFPIGAGAILPLQANAIYTGLVNDDPAMLLGVYDIFKVGIIPSILMTLYCIFGWRLIPKNKINTALAGPVHQSENKDLPKYQEYIVYAVFVIVMVSFLFSSKLGSLIYILPTIGILVFIYTNTLSIKEVTATLASDMVFMTAGVLVISTGLGNSGAGQLIGAAVLKILGSNPSSLMVITVFCIASVIMTTFLSNLGTLAVMTPIAASTALAGGMNPKAVVLVVFCSSCLAIAFPTGCAAATFGFAVGNHNPVKMLKFTLPFLLIGMVSLIICAEIFYPVY